MFYFIPTPIGNLKDISLRTFDVLKDIDIILCEDTRVTKKLLSLTNNFQLKSDIKFISVHSHNESNFVSKLDIDFFDQNIAYMSDAGMPCVSDPGALIVSYLLDNNISYEVLPGANAILLAYASSGFTNKEFKFFGFLPHRGRTRSLELQRVVNSGCISIVYESPYRLLSFFEELVTINPSLNVFVIKEATKLYEYKLRGSAKDVYDILKSSATIKGEWCIVLESKSSVTSTLLAQDVMDLNISPKEKAKLLSKLSNKSIKECYQELIG
ncbi:MAG: rRNA small subunit methyltransferase I [uncultured Campylobacterales bacterium]|uniref:Ribosomal RNA small subunit methyltransferase I n=1 Tax=uncultured Campylobacterales bacterium TaxID=352960 RepID=A0A6S6SMY6_9BACT|nr:MAG: rRNA small subunit methyltransferase I [uncultured Campylobacterales bacterium]